MEEKKPMPSGLKSLRNVAYEIEVLALSGELVSAKTRTPLPSVVEFDGNDYEAHEYESRYSFGHFSYDYRFQAVRA